MEKLEKEKMVKEIKETAPANLPTYEEERMPASRIVWRVLILGAVLIVLVVVSIGIIKLVPRALSSLASVNVSISSLFTPSKTATSSTNSNQNNVIYSSSTPNNVVAGGNATTSAPRSVSNGNTGNYNYSNNTSGTPDLAVTITSIGVLDRNTGAFVPTTNVNTNDRVAVKFQVENVGGGSSGAWNLTANLPAVNPADQTKVLANQVSIPAGMAVAGELYFDYVQTGQNRVVQITISGSRAEASTANNIAQVTINSTGNPYNNNYYPYNNNGYSGVYGVDLSVRTLSAQGGTAQFQVTNLGNQPSGPWTYTINSNNNSYNNNYPYNNTYNTQASLAPGQSAVVTVNSGYSYGNYYGGSNYIQITIDPYNQTNDVNRSNNTATANI